ncbi:hypothetical protein [Conexibacter sp. SYSU D00693]|uniref:hypothetical protein n=1 Tax=Conexibacter sp. SYSU D00693 TaxID=2812560 RepID=UPI00196A6856|nr:hypothetical protein [Conexibacter sp. SYSU D00693]
MVRLRDRLTGEASLLHAAIVLGLVALVVYSGYVKDGPFLMDDWSNSALTQYPGDQSAISAAWDLSYYRPVLPLYVPVTHWLFGESAALHIAYAIALATGASLALVQVLRLEGLRTWHAIAIGVLALLFPASDSTRLWATASMAHFAILVALLGLLAAIRGARLTAEGKPDGRRWHALAVTLYLMSILGYEVGAPVIALFGLLYLRRMRSREALLRWGADLIAIAASLLWIGTKTPREISSGGALFDHFDRMLDEGLTVIASFTLPLGEASRNTILWSSLLLVAAGLVVWRALPRDDESRARLGGWLGMVAVGVVLTAAGWAMFIPADPVYSPGSQGLLNRTNAVAGIGVVTLVYALLGVLGTLVFRGLPRGRMLAGLTTLALGALLANSYAQDVGDDISRYIAAGHEEDRILGVIARTVPAGARDATIYTTGHPGYEALGIPIFTATWDLDGAVKVRYDRPDWRAVPITEGVALACTREGVFPDGSGGGPTFGAAYGKAWLVDVVAGKATQLTSQARCEAVAKALAPPPLIKPSA